MKITDFLTVAFILLTIFSIAKFLARKGKSKEYSLFFIIPSMSALLVSIMGLIQGTDMSMPSVTVAFTCLACAISILETRTRAAFLIPYLAIVSAMALAGLPLLLAMTSVLGSFVILALSFSKRFSDAKELVKKQALSMLIIDWMSSMVGATSMLISSVSSILYGCGDMLSTIILRIVAGFLSISLFAVLYVRCLTGKMPFLGENKLNDIENHTLTYVRNDIIANADESTMRIYNRIHEYIVIKQNFLNPNLSETEVARAVYVNKAYVGRAILKMTGKNYCTYVGTYRVQYAMDLFEQDPTLKPGQLALQSGFKNEASMNLMFKNLVGMKPSDWIAMRHAQMKK